MSQPATPRADAPLPAMLLPVLGSSRLFEHIETLRGKWDEEQDRRARFRDEVRADQKHEFINGEIIVSSPSRLGHSRIVGRLLELLRVFNRLHAPGAIAVVEKAMIDCGRNDYEPDLIWYSPASAPTLDDDMVTLPPPDLAVEVLSPSTAARDRKVKFQDYAFSGISEYWIVDGETRTVERHRLDPATRAYRPPETGPDIAWRPDTGIATDPATADAGTPPEPTFPARTLFDEDAMTDALRALTAN